DWIDAAEPVPVRLAFQLHPDVTATLDGAHAVLRWNGGAAAMQLPPELDWQVHRGEDNPPLRWYSPEVGEKGSSATLIGSGTLEAGARLHSSISAGIDAAMSRDRAAGVTVKEVGA